MLCIKKWANILIVLNGEILTAGEATANKQRLQDGSGFTSPIPINEECLDQLQSHSQVSVTDIPT